MKTSSNECSIVIDAHNDLMEILDGEYNSDTVYGHLCSITQSYAEVLAKYASAKSHLAWLELQNEKLTEDNAVLRKSIGHGM